MLNEEQRAVQLTARRFAQAQIKPFAAQWDREGMAPRELYRSMGKVGLMGMCVPAEQGGAGADFVAYVLAMEEIAAADCGVANMMAATSSPVAAAIARHGSAMQQSTYLGKLCSGEFLGAILLTEPQAGSDAANIKTQARPHGAGFRLEGTKRFITGGRSADVALIVAVTDPSAGKRGITCFVCPTDRLGYEVVREERKLGHRTNDTCEICLDGLEVGHDEVLGETGRGLGIALGHLSAGRIAVAAQAVGVARAAFEAAVAFARDRETFGKPIIEHQSIAFQLAEMSTDIEVARQMYLYAAQLERAMEPSIREASMAKLFASEMAERVCSKAIQVHGGYGLMNECPVEKYYRDARVLQIYEGTSEVQKIVISRLISAE
ncbi:MAG: butyryl-CoA dehydrogenase [Gammaproteobacteria bacterium]